MNRQQIVNKHRQISKYQQTNKIRLMFGTLIKQLLLKRPDDPISHLIEYLNTSCRRRLIICINGYHKDDRIRLSTTISNKLNYHHINLNAVFKVNDYYLLSDDVINQQVIKSLKSVPEIYKGVVISGYPCNLAQIDFIQKSTLVIPDRYFMMQCSTDKLRHYYQGQKYEPKQVQLMLIRHQIQSKQYKQVLGQLVDQVSDDVQQAADKIVTTLNVKANKPIIPISSPRIVAIYPPYLIPKSLPALINRFSLNYLSVQSALSKLQHKSNFKQYVDTYIRKHQSISKEIQLALVENQAKSVVSKNKGFVIAGWPQQISTLPLLQQYFIKPHIVLVFRQIREKLLEHFDQLQPSNLQTFPISYKPTQEQYLEQLKTHNEMVEQLKQQNNIHIVPFNQSQTQLIKLVENLLSNVNVYN